MAFGVCSLLNLYRTSVANVQHFLSHPARQSERDAVKRFSNFMIHLK